MVIWSLVKGIFKSPVEAKKEVIQSDLGGESHLRHIASSERASLEKNKSYPLNKLFAKNGYVWQNNEKYWEDNILGNNFDLNLDSSELERKLASLRDNIGRTIDSYGIEAGRYVLARMQEKANLLKEAYNIDNSRGFAECENEDASQLFENFIDTIDYIKLNYTDNLQNIPRKQERTYDIFSLPSRRPEFSRTAL